MHRTPVQTAGRFALDVFAELLNTRTYLRAITALSAYMLLAVSWG